MTSRFDFRALLCAVALSAVAFAGCGGSGPTHPTAKVAGKVTLDGNPIAAGTLQFIPLENNAAKPASGAIKDGAYIAEVPHGKVKVNFSAVRETGKVDNSHDPPIKEVENIIPGKYALGWDIEVTGDNPALDFPLTTAP